MNNFEIGKFVKKRRKFLGLRQRDLSELAGVTLRSLTELEKGRGNPTINQISKILEVLGMEISFVERSAHAKG